MFPFFPFSGQIISSFLSRGESRDNRLGNYPNLSGLEEITYIVQTLPRKGLKNAIQLSGVYCSNIQWYHHGAYAVFPSDKEEPSFVLRKSSSGGYIRR